ncbi:MAG: hypothetical protein WCI84_10760, partial [Bacteroidota bacterium]
MKKNIFVLTALWSFLFIHHIALTQVRSTDRAVVFTKSGTGTSGYLLEIRIGTEDDTLVIVSTKGTELIQVGELSKIIILSREQEGNLFLAGAIVGTYISTLMI